MKKTFRFYVILLLFACLMVPNTVFAKDANVKDLEIGDSEISVSVHCKWRVYVWDRHLSGAVDGVVWSSSDDSIAVVDQQGWVTGKATGEAVVTGTYEGNTFTCNVKVTQNRMRFAKYSKKASKYKKGQMIFKFSEASIDKDGTLTLKGDFINTYGRKVKYAKKVKFSLYYYGKRFKKQTVSKISLNVKAKKSKGVTLKFKNIDQKVDLNMGNLTIMYSGGKVK